MLQTLPGRNYSMYIEADEKIFEKMLFKKCNINFITLVESSKFYDYMTKIVDFIMLNYTQKKIICITL